MSGPMAGFSFAQGRAFGDGVELRDIAARAGTPVYVYSAAVIRERYQLLDRAFTRHPHRLHYAIKANATTAVAALLRELGAGADANSGGEIEVALRAVRAQLLAAGADVAVGRHHHQRRIHLDRGHRFLQGLFR